MDVDTRLQLNKLLNKILILVLFSTLSLRASPVALYESFAGNMNFVMAGGSLRTNADGVDSCSVTTGPVSASVSGIPGGSTIVAAYLYWAGSGTTVDSAVTFNGNNVTADRTFTEQFILSPTTYDFFGGFKDVTSFVSGNGSYSFNNLTVNNGAPFCAVQAVLSGWALVVIYSNPSEDFRVINVFDGLQQFRGSSVTLTPNNFEIPASPINGKFGVISWEGDVGNSASLNGFTEDILFNGSPLTDAANPANNQYNSTINTYDNTNNYYGVDIDTYDIGSYLTAGDTSASTTYSSGGDLVLLAAEVISVTNVPVSDLKITKTHSGNFSVGQNGVYTIGVQNLGPNDSDGLITVTDTLHAGYDFVSATGTGWTCGYSAPTVTCTRTGILANGASAPNITLTVFVNNSAPGTINNTANVVGPNFDNHEADNTVTDPTTIIAPDFSTSTKSVSDLNGGEADVGDVLRYTITLNNSTAAPATGVSVTDDIPALINSFTVVSIPGGATNSSTGAGTGANNTGYLNITNISVPANDSVTIVFDVTIDASANPGDFIDNTATITTPAGVGASPSASTVTVSPSQVAGSGMKELYFAIPAAGTRYIQRNQPAGAAATNTQTINGAGANQNFVLNPALATDLVVGSGNSTVTIRMACANQCGAAARQRTILVTLQYWNGASWVTMGSQSQTFNLGAAGVYSTQTFTINVGADTTVNQGNQLRVLVTNNTAQAGRHIIIMPLNGGIYSRLTLNALTVINVDSCSEYTAAYPSMSVASFFDPNTTAYIRCTISDPFGSFDITSARITIVNPNSITTVNNQLMTEVFDSGAATKIYQYTYLVPNAGPSGNWSYTAVGHEGAEGTITDSKVDGFRVGNFVPTIVKSSVVLSDPINITTNPKRIPGAVIRYSILVTNNGRGFHDTASLVITDVLPPNMTMCVTTACTGGPNPVEFIDGTPSSNLTVTYGSHVYYSNQVGGGAPYNYTPSPDGQGYDANITGIRVLPAGTMAHSSGTPPNPNFTLRIVMKVK